MSRYHRGFLRCSRSCSVEQLMTILILNLISSWPGSISFFGFSNTRRTHVCNFRKKYKKQRKLRNRRVSRFAIRLQERNGCILRGEARNHVPLKETAEGEKRAWAAFIFRCIHGTHIYSTCVGSSSRGTTRPSTYSLYSTGNANGTFAKSGDDGARRTFRVSVRPPFVSFEIGNASTGSPHPP